jgi:ParB-like chromosome segregation protein Spo0J
MATRALSGLIGKGTGGGWWEQLPAGTVRISRLRVTDSPRLRGTDAGHVRALVESASVLPPIVVHRPSMSVIDGAHRLSVAVQCGVQEIEARFFDGDDDEAFVLAVEANVTHGLPLSLADRKAAATRLIHSYPQWSDRAIADVVRLSPKTIGAMRARATEDAPRLPARIGRDGKARPVDSAEGRRAAGEFLAAHPDASVREVAKAVGIAPGTARDVRQRWRNGEELVPKRGRPAATGEPTADVVPLTSSVAVRSRMAALLKDPGLRHTETGRMLLRLLDATMRVRDDCGLVDSVPEHCVGLVAEVARECSNAWREFAERVQSERRSVGS